MKKLKKRFVAMIMALTMVFSFSTVAFAAETEENNNMTIARTAEEQNDIEPMADLGFSGNKRTTYTIPITLGANDRYLYWSVSAYGPLRLTMYKDGVQVSRVYYTEKKNKGVCLPIVKNGSTTDNRWEQGTYTIIVEVLFDSAHSFTIIPVYSQFS